MRMRKVYFNALSRSKHREKNGTDIYWIPTAWWECYFTVVVDSLSRVWLFWDSHRQGSSVHGIFQAGILEWVAISITRESSPPRHWTQVFCISRQILYHQTYQGSPTYRYTYLIRQRLLHGWRAYLILSWVSRAYPSIQQVLNTCELWWNWADLSSTRFRTAALP